MYLYKKKSTNCNLSFILNFANYLVYVRETFKVYNKLELTLN